METHAKNKKQPVRDRNRIAFFVPSLHIGGVESVFISYATILADKGYVVDLVVCKTEGVLLEKLPPQVRLVSLGNIKLRHAFSHLRRYLLTQDTGTMITGPDVTNFIAILTNLSLPRKRRVNLIISQHNIPDQDAKDIGLIGRLIPLGKKLLYRHADTIMSVSQGVTQNLIETGIPVHKIATIQNPIHISKIQFLSQETLDIVLPEQFIVFVGRLYAVKNIELLIRAFAELEDDTLHLVIVGDGPLRTALEALARDKKVDSKTIFTGALPNPAPVISRAEIVAVPSWSEAFPMVVIESAALGKTIVHTPNSGCREILGSGNSYCSETFDDPTEFAQMIRKALQNPILPDQITSIVREFDEAMIIPKLEALLKVRLSKTS